MEKIYRSCTVIALLMGLVVMSGCGEALNQEKEMVTAPATTYKLWGRPSKTVNSSARVFDTNIGQVIVKDAETGAVLTVMVIPFREISAGSLVQVAEVDYQLNYFKRGRLLVVVSTGN